ncbi:MAG TPA: ATP-binding protein, partial [bacterium]|nr:ATP-binding protein [bacterium]
KAEEALRASEMRFRKAQEISHLGSWELDLVNNRLVWSDEIYRIFGLKPQEFDATYEAFLAAVHPEDRTEVDAAYSGSLRAGKDIYEIEHRVVRKSDAEIRIVHEKCEHVRDASGKVVRSIGMVHDITEKKSAEEILARDREMLEKLVEERSRRLADLTLELERSKRLSDMGTLAATVAHELRNPLAAINMAAANIRRKADNPLLDNHLNNIKKKVQESAQIINNLLFYSRLGPPNHEEVLINHILKECMASSLRQFGFKKMSFRKRLVSTKDIFIEADPVQVKEIFSNILNNSCDALPESGGRIEIVTENNEDYVKLRISDNGHGIDKEKIERIFEPFFTTKAKGTGLGLSVCQQIVNMHGGTINIESERNKGTAVFITLPKKAKRITGR